MSAQKKLTVLRNVQIDGIHIPAGTEVEVGPGQAEGETIRLTAGQAQRLINLGKADYAGEGKVKRETASLKSPETADKK